MTSYSSVTTWATTRNGPLASRMISPDMSASRLESHDGVRDRRSPSQSAFSGLIVRPTGIDFRYGRDPWCTRSGPSEPYWYGSRKMRLPRVAVCWFQRTVLVAPIHHTGSPHDGQIRSWPSPARPARPGKNPAVKPPPVLGVPHHLRRSLVCVYCLTV